MNLAQPIEQLSNCQNRRWIIWGHLKWYKQRMNGVLALKGNQKNFEQKFLLLTDNFLSNASCKLSNKSSNTEKRVEQLPSKDFNSIY